MSHRFTRDFTTTGKKFKTQIKSDTQYYFSHISRVLPPDVETLSWAIPIPSSSGGGGQDKFAKI